MWWFLALPLAPLSAIAACYAHDTLTPAFLLAAIAYGYNLNWFGCVIFALCARDPLAALLLLTLVPLVGWRGHREILFLSAAKIHYGNGREAQNLPPPRGHE